ncbi:uncharacterized protein C9orf57 homolog [Equus asinus]|uniref:uncharacterized protein C9orf57 homolog n=1 Tax=Equus asinus TaxID=9793 RepID=UPI0038F6CFB4
MSLPRFFLLWPPSLFSPYFFSPIFGDAGCLICRYCNLSVPFHGCLLDFGTCIAKPGQHCIKEVHIKGGIQWYSVKGCTENTTVCFKRVMKSSEIHTTHCCHRPLCNF